MSDTVEVDRDALQQVLIGARGNPDTSLATDEATRQIHETLHE